MGNKLYMSSRVCKLIKYEDLLANKMDPGSILRWLAYCI